MAFFDQTLLLSSAQAVTATAASTNLYDVAGVGSGVAPNVKFGDATVFGADMGAGQDGITPTAFFTIPTSFTTGTAGTLSIQIQAAPDNGSNAPGTYQTLSATAAFTVTGLVAGMTIQLPIPPVAPTGGFKPRFYRFNYVVTNSFTAGTITGVILLNPPSGQVGSNLYPNNFTAV